MARNANLVHNNRLEQNGAALLELGSAEWFAWLESNNSFAYAASVGNFSARKEARPGGLYWYAYRRQNKKLRRLYLGKSNELSATRLAEVAAALAKLGDELPSNPPSQVTQTAIAARELLLATKITMPPAYQKIVTRPQLDKLLEEIFSSKLAIIVAPPGFGKTTLLVDWLRRRSVLAAWFSLDENDNDPVRFWQYCLTALDKLHPGISCEALTLLKAPQPPQIEAVLTLIINAFSNLDGQNVLVLDDYHLITTATIHSALNFLLDNLPPNLHLLITSRAQLPLPLTRLRARGQVVEIGTGDLRFSQGEAAIFLNERMQLKLDAPDLEKLVTRTEGWITGLQLTALSLQKRSDASGFIKNFGGNERFVLDYLAEEVLARQPLAVQNFLLDTAVLERLNAGLSAAVSGETEAQAMLEQLEQANLFVVPLDEARHWYRYHQLFADFLRSRVPQERLAGLHQRAARWYAANDFVVEALNHAFLAADNELAVTLLEQNGRDFLKAGEVTTMLNWLKQLPERLRQSNYRLCVYYAWVLVVSGQTSEAEAYLHFAETASATADLSESERRQLLSEVVTIRLIGATFQIDAARILELVTQNQELLAENSPFLRGFQNLSSAMVFEFSSQVEQARQAYQAAIANGQAAGNLLVSLVATAQLGDIEVAQGQLHQAAQTYRQALALVELQSRPIPAVSVVYSSLAQIHYHWNELDKASNYVQKGLELGEQLGNALFLMLANIVQAQILQAYGDKSGALAAIELAMQRVIQTEAAPMMVNFLKSMQVRCWVRQGNLAAAQHWADNYYQTSTNDDGLNGQLRMVENVELGRVFLATGQPAKTIEVLNDELAQALLAVHATYRLEAMLLQALAHVALGKTEQAYQILTQVLNQTAPQGYIRIFLDEGQPMAALLHQYKTVAPVSLQSYLKTILSNFGDTTAQNLAQSAREQNQKLVEALSEREMTVLRLLAAGLSNQEIARQLVVEVSTIKTHLIRLYSKLAVHTRTQAVSRAKELNLL